jgi:hypothetical protein
MSTLLGSIHTARAARSSGGDVYRGGRWPPRATRYCYADLCNGNFSSFVVVNGQATGLELGEFRVVKPTTFGQDPA